MKTFFSKNMGWIFFLGILVVFALGMADRNFYIGGDLMIPLSPTQNIEKIYLWSNGQESFNFCASLLFVYYLALEHIGISPNYSQKVLILIGFAGQFVFMYKLFLLLLNKPYEQSRRLMAYAAAIIYTLSPSYFLVTNGFLPLLGFPLLTYILILYLKSGSVVKAMLFSLVLNFFFLSDMPQPKMTLIYIIAAVFVVFVFRCTQGISLKRVVRRILALSLICLATNLWLLVPLAQSALYGNINVFTKSVAKYNGMADLNLADIYYIGRFFNHNIIEGYPKLSKYLEGPVFILYTLGLWLLLTVGTYRVLNKQNERRVLTFLYLVLLLFICLAKGPNPPLGWVYRLFVINVPYAGVFRTTSSIAVAASFFFSLAVPFALGALLSKATRKKVIFTFSFLIIASVLVFLPILLGFKFYNQKGSLSQQKGYAIPESYFKVNDVLSKLNDDYKILSLPMINGYVKKNWGYFGPDIMSWITNRTDYFSINDYGLSLDRKDTLFSQPKPYATRDWNNIGYILLQKDTVGGFLPEPSNFGDKELLYNDKYLSLYSLEKESSSSSTEVRTISQYANFSGNIDKASDVKDLVIRTGLQDFVVVDRKPTSGPLYTLAKETQQMITDAPEWNRGWSWPQASIDPKSIFYTISEVREYLAEYTAPKVEDKYDLQLWDASKRLEEINTYDLDTATLERNLYKYDQEISTLISALNKITKEKRDKDYWGFVQKMLAYTRKGYQTLSVRDPKIDLTHLNRVKESYMYVWDWAKRNADYGCASYCYKLDVIADGEYTIYVNDPEAKEIDIPPLGVFPLQVTEDSKWAYTAPIKLKKQQYSSKLIYEGDRNLAGGKSWVKFNGTIGVSDAKTPEWLFGTTNTNLKLGKEKLNVISTSDAYYYLPISSWESGTTYNIAFDYNTGQGTLRTLVMYQPDVSEGSVWNAEDNLQEPQYIVQFSNDLSYFGDSNVGCDYKEEGTCFAHTEFSFTSSIAGKNGKFVITGTQSNQPGTFYSIGIRNLKITKVKPATIVAYSAFNEQPTFPITFSSSVVAYKKINPTKYLVKLVNPKKDSYLVLNENFGAWKVYLPGNVADSKLLPKQLETLFLPGIPESNHFTINGFANAWKIEPAQFGSQEELNLVIEYFPQKVFNISASLSFFVVILILIFAGVNNLLRAVNEHKKSN